MRIKTRTSAALAATTTLVVSLLAGVGNAPSIAVGPAPVGLTLVRQQTLPAVNGGSLYTFDPSDESFWVLQEGNDNTNHNSTLKHFDSTGNEIVADTFSPYTRFQYAQSMAVTQGRVFIYQSTILWSFLLRGDGEIGRTFSDNDTEIRTGGFQAILRATSAGQGLAVFGQAGKFGVFDLTPTGVANRYYPQAFYGYGINSDSDSSWQSCSLTTAASTTCGTKYGKAPIGYPIDSAIAGSTLFLAESGGNRVSSYDIANNYAPITSFGSGGSGNGQLDTAQSITYDPASQHLFVSDAGNVRISEWTLDGTFLAGYGNGVADGTDTFQTCGPSSVACRKGVTGSSASYGSYFSRLDMGSDGMLYAWNPITSTVNVYSLTGGTTTTPPGTNPPAPPVGPDTIAFAASATKVKRGKPVTLTATIGPAPQCAARQVQVQTLVKKKRKPATWVPVATLPGAGCVATTQLKVNAKKVYRAVVLAGGAVSAVSDQVSVKPK